LYSYLVFGYNNTMISKLTSVTLLLALSAPLVSAACDFCHKKTGGCRDCEGTGKDGAWDLDYTDNGNGPCPTCRKGSIRVVDCASKEKCKFDKSIKMPNPTGPWLDSQLTKLRAAQKEGNKDREHHYKNKIEESYSLDWQQQQTDCEKRPARCCNSVRRIAGPGKCTCTFGGIFSHWATCPQAGKQTYTSRGTCMNTPWPSMDISEKVCYACLCCCAVCDKYEHMLLPIPRMPTQCFICDGWCCDTGCIQRYEDEDVCINCLPEASTPKSEQKTEETDTPGNSPRREPMAPTYPPPDVTFPISNRGLDGWTEHQDPVSGRLYYYKNGKSQWQPPHIPCYAWGGNKGRSG